MKLPTRALRFICLSGLAVITACRPSADSSPELSPLDAPSVYHRVLETEQAVILETATVALTLEDGREVDLVGVVHLAQKDYFQSLNQALATYDLVLYELLGKGEQTVLPPYPKTRRDEVLRRRLGLVYQAAEVDYGSDSFLHADLTEAELAQFDNRSTHPKSDRLFQILAQGESIIERQRLFLSELKALTVIIGGEEYGAELAAARHEAVLNALHSPRARKAKSIAIFYGTSHLPAIKEKLSAHALRFVTWRQAWHVPES